MRALGFPTLGFLYILLISSISAQHLYQPCLACSGASIPRPAIPGASIISIAANKTTDFEGIAGNDVCFITVVLTHPGVNDRVNNYIVLPLTTWNGIFQGIGGGGYDAGTVASTANATSLGYSAGTTDAGLAGTTEGDANGWALLSPGNSNLELLLNFGRRSLHDMTILGKDISAAFYGRDAVDRAYWNGCSTGGREGMVFAQYYPNDYDGIIANAPAIQWTDFTFAQQWPYTLESQSGVVLSPCVEAVVVAAAIKACDGLDGLVDGIISAPAICNFQATDLVGKTYECEGVTQTWTKKTAKVVDGVWQGPRTPEGAFLWYGLTKGANLTSLAPNTNGTVAVPFSISESWIQGFVVRDTSFDVSTISYDEFADLFLQSHIQYDSLLGEYSPNLKPFKQAGGKMITWQGLADNLINPQGTMLYYSKVAAIDPSVGDFYRQFFSPGIGHCGGGTGVLPTDQLNQLRAWVENGTAPSTLHAGSAYPVNASSSYPAGATNVRFMDLCPYPQVQKYKGGGVDASLASSWMCAEDTQGWESFPGPSGSNYSCVGGPGWYA